MFRSGRERLCHQGYRFRCYRFLQKIGSRHQSKPWFEYLCLLNESGVHCCCIYKNGWAIIMHTHIKHNSVTNAHVGLYVEVQSQLRFSLALVWRLMLRRFPILRYRQAPPQA